MYNYNCRPSLSRTHSLNYRYSCLLYDGDARFIKATAGPLHAGHIPSTTGIVAWTLLDTQHVYLSRCR